MWAQAWVDVSGLPSFQMIVEWDKEATAAKRQPATRAEPQPQRPMPMRELPARPMPTRELPSRNRPGFIRGRSDY